MYDIQREDFFVIFKAAQKNVQIENVAFRFHASSDILILIMIVFSLACVEISNLMKIILHRMGNLRIILNADN